MGNVRLSAEERCAALSLQRALNEAYQLYHGGCRDAEEILSRVRRILKTEPLIKVDYVELRDAESLAPVTNMERPALLALAAYVGGTRLIDNHVLGR